MNEPQLGDILLVKQAKSHFLAPKDDLVLRMGIRDDLSTFIPGEQREGNRNQCVLTLTW